MMEKPTEFHGSIIKKKSQGYFICFANEKQMEILD